MYNFVDMYMYYLKHVECYCIRWVIMQLSSDIVDFDLFYDKPVDMQMYMHILEYCVFEWIFFSYYSLHSSNVTWMALIRFWNDLLYVHKCMFTST